MTAKIAKVTAGTLTSADLLTDLGLSLSSSSLTDPISAWQLDYLESVLSTTSGTAKATWQTTLDNYNAASANALGISGKLPLRRQPLALTPPAMPPIKCLT